MRPTLYAFCLAFLLCFSFTAFAQETPKDRITKALSDYFFLERENIHVQFNKNIYMTDEQVWFKGYVFHRKKNIPFFSTTNVFVSLLDDTGKVLETKLLYGNIGSFSGNFKLGNSFKSGKYYLQFYTNWMNNFLENESSVYEITIINRALGAGNALAKSDPSKLNIQLTPEGGILADGVANTIGISIADCNGGTVNTTTVDITDSAGKVIQKVQLNKKGFGRYELPAGATGYKAVVTIDDKKHEMPFPQPQLKGLALEANSYATPGKTLITLRPNKGMITSLSGKPVYILLHQDEKAILYEVPLTEDNPSQKMAIKNEDLFDGMNTIRILDSDLNQLAERLVYKYPAETLKAEISAAGQSKDSMKFTGTTGYSNMNISLSILPENTISINETNDIYGSFLILPYVSTDRKIAGQYYFGSLSKVKMYELDLFLLSQKSKYEWRNILLNPPKNTYPFEMGLTVKGTVPKNAGDTKFSQVRLYSLTSAIDERTDVNEKREFEIKNLVIADSAYVNFTLLRKGQKPKELTLAPQVLNGIRKFNKPYQPQPKYYIPVTEDSSSTPNIFKEMIQLEEVKVEGTRLKYANSFGNGNLRAHKISDSQAYMYQNLLNYIKTYGGFNVSNSNGQVRITARTTTTMNGATAGPILFIDNMQQMDYAILDLIQLSEVDEIYMSPHAIVPSVRNYIGIIRVYLKKGAKISSKNSTPEIIVKNAFEKVLPFENIIYNSTNDKGFENFGVIGWEPQIMTDDKGSYDFRIPKTGQKTLKILIEGFSADGKLLSETKTITVE
jgi:hypothetical protein